ncbi:MAG: fimbrillin family protein [Rikenellaceae bacterium]
MKKILLSLAVLATVASCSKNEVVDVAPTNELGFVSLNDRLSLKSANDEADPYYVYAVAGTSTSFFLNGLKVTTAAGVDSWTGNYYWFADKTAIDFYAYSGGSATLNATTPTTTSIKVDYTVPTGADDDFTASQVLGQTGETNTNVAFEFQHLLSKVSVAYQLTTELTNAGYSINSDATATLTVVNNNGTVDIVAASPVVAAGTVPNEAPVYSGRLTNYMILPQDASDCTVQLNGVKIQAPDDSYIKGSADAGADFSALSFPSTTLAEFKPGEHYLVTITISATTEGLLGNEITFTSKTADWNTVAGQGVGLDQ